MSMHNMQHEQFETRAKDLMESYLSLSEERSYERKDKKSDMSPGEDVVIRKAMCSELNGFLLVFVLFVVANMIVFAYPGSLMPIFFGYIGNVPLGVLVPLPCILPLLVLLSVIGRVYDERYILGRDSLVLVKGLSKFSMNTIEVFYDNVVAVSIDQTPMERLLNVGTVTLRLPGDGLAAVSLSGVRNPSQYKGMIERRLSYMLQ